MLNKQNLAVKEICSKDYSRYHISMVKVEKKRTIGTNGHIMAEIERPKKDLEDYPALPENMKVTEKDFYIEQDVVKKLEKAIPHIKTMDILNHAIPCENDDNKIHLLTNDLDSQNDIAIQKHEVNYPNTDSVYPTEKPVFEIGLNIEVLDSLVRLLKKFKGKAGLVKFQFHDKLSAVYYECENSDTEQKLKGCLMPMRMD
jgi:hypothetical protein